MKATTLCSLLICSSVLVWLCCSCFSKSIQGNTEAYNLNGKWQVYDMKLSNEKYAYYEMTGEDKAPCLLSVIFISDSGVKVRNDSCFWGESCDTTPMFKFTKFSVTDTAVSDPWFFKQINYTSDSIVSVTSSCDLPYFNDFFLLSKDTIIIGGNGALHFLRRISGK